MVRRSPRITAARRAQGCGSPGDGEDSSPGRGGATARTPMQNASKSREVRSVRPVEPSGEDGLRVPLLRASAGAVVMGEAEGNRECGTRGALQDGPSGGTMDRSPNRTKNDLIGVSKARTPGATLGAREENQAKAPPPGSPSKTTTPTKRGVGAPVEAGPSADIGSKTPETAGYMCKSPARARLAPGPGGKSPARARLAPGPGGKSPARARLAPGPGGQSPTSAAPGPFGKIESSNHVTPGASSGTESSARVAPGPSCENESSASSARTCVSPSPIGETESSTRVAPGPSGENESSARLAPGPSSETPARTRVTPGPSSEAEASAQILPGPSHESGSNGPVTAFSSESGEGPVVAAGPSSADQVLDYRVRCFSKELVQDVLEMCTEFSKEILDSQEYLSQDRREQELKNCIWNFQTSFQENVVVNGQSWHDAADTQNEPDLKILEDRLDDLIVDTTRKRKFHPRKIVSHVRRMLNTERDILGQHKPVVTPEDFKLDSHLVERMADLTADTSTVSKQISETMKALPSQIKKAEGFSQVVSLQPVLEDSRIRREIFSCQVKPNDLAKSRPKPVETTPSDNPSQPKTTPILKRKRPSSPSRQNLYPLRSKRKS